MVTSRQWLLLLLLGCRGDLSPAVLVNTSAVVLGEDRTIAPPFLAVADVTDNFTPPLAPLTAMVPLLPLLTAMLLLLPPLTATLPVTRDTVGGLADGDVSLSLGDNAS